MDVKDLLSAYYESYDEEGRLLSRHGQVEYLTTMRYIRRYLKPGDRILEIGPGTGRYSHALALEGYEVEAVELVEHNIELFKAKTQPGEKISIRQGTATNLSYYADDSFDITLLLGPMYHLFTEEEAKKALSEAVRVTKKGGVIFVSYCLSDASILAYGFIKGHIKEILENGMLDPVTFTTFSPPEELFVLYRGEQIKALRSGLPVQPLHYVATDGYTHHMRETVDEMDDETFQIYLRYHFAVCERADLVGISHHSLDIFRKEE